MAEPRAQETVGLESLSLDDFEPETPTFAPAPALPAELIDLILDFVFQCRRHPWATANRPCANHHAPSQLPSLLALRLVNRAFRTHTTPALFRHIICSSERRRQQNLSEISRHPLRSHIRVLQIELAPKDLGGRMRRVNVALVDPAKKLLNYFEVLRIYLTPVLRRFEDLKELELVTTYKGLVEKRLPKNQVMVACIENMCKAIRLAEMPNLKEVTLGVPHEGGYTNHFEDLDAKLFQKLLRGTGKGVKTASIKLFEVDGGFTRHYF